MSVLTNDAEQRQSKPAKTSKGEKVPVRIEFEQRWLLDPRRSDAIFEELCQPHASSGPIRLANFANPRPGMSVCCIRQFYDNGDRFRCISDTWNETGIVAPQMFIKEKKKSINLDAPYSANSEDETALTEDEFEMGWKTATRRLQKVRFLVPSTRDEHRTVVDIFYTFNKDGSTRAYSVTAEDEVLLDGSTKSLYLEFGIPIYLHQYIVAMVDNRIPEMKQFRSANMIDDPDTIAAFEKAISQLYESS